MTVKTAGTPATKIRSTPVNTPGRHRGQEEMIVLTVRLRPLNRREEASKDHVAWDCTDDCTIVYNPTPHERVLQQSSFTFDRIFGPNSMTEAVYEEGVKNVALSALMGINATIFAYEQTSSGKTYMMRGVTEKGVNDIYMHILNNIVDLAGSERASQTQADGARLREGYHINLSLMTLTTVVRKLSVGKRGYIPYRDSKLTQILQHSLGGNARTTIICTLSPASSNIEQTFNTISFASRAKEETNKAQVNMVVMEKNLVKHLQKEVARLEAELRTPDLINDNDLKIQQMELDMAKSRQQTTSLSHRQRNCQGSLRKCRQSHSPTHILLL